MISILMPVKNAAPFLKACIQSILNQTETNWELIAVNDHSTDETEQILKLFSEKDRRITYLNNTGKGIIEALSLAFENCTGSLISRMDADDIMNPNKLASLNETLLKNSTGIATAKVNYIAEHKLGDGYLKYEKWLNNLIDNNSQFNEIYKECVLPSPNWMMTKETLKKMGGFESLEYPEDYDLCFKAYAFNIPIIGADEITHQWRDYPERTSRNDPNYADNRFTEMKVRYFVKCDYSPTHQLILWGAGKRAKLIANELIEHQIPFKWITNNKKKIGHKINDVLIEDVPETITDKTQIIIGVGAIDAQEEIKIKIEGHPNTFWFC